MFAVACLRQLIQLCHQSYTEAVASAPSKAALNAAPPLVNAGSVDPRHAAHFNLTLARKFKATGGGSDWLVLHLSDLVKMAFIAAAGSTAVGCDRLRILGLASLQDLIRCFGPVPDPDSPGKF